MPLNPLPQNHQEGFSHQKQNKIQNLYQNIIYIDYNINQASYIFAIC